MTRRRVFIQGMGAYTPLGSSWPTTRTALAAGASAVQQVTHFDVAGFPATTAAAITAQSDGEDRRLPMVEHAAREAWAQSGLDPCSGRVGIFVGAESGRPSFRAVVGMARAAGGGTEFDRAQFELQAEALVEHAEVLSPAAVASALAREVEATGPVQTLSLACASGSAAIAEAVRALRQGACELALCGGVGADVDPFMMAGFGLLSALSARGISCPFDVRRDGFVLGEGAAMFVLSCERGDAQVEMLGIGRSLDAYRLTAPDPAGHGAALAMELALADSGVGRIDYVQAHGTSTPLNDAVEAAAIRRVLGHSADAPRVSSVKGALGHTIAAAGALGLACAAEAVASQLVLPTAGLREPDSDCSLAHVMGEAIEAPVRAAMVNAFAFGGANCSLVVGRQ